MPILAVCPYCHEGKVRAADGAEGLSATCPRCYNCFTLVASTARLKAPVRSSVPVPPPPPPAIPAPEPTEGTVGGEGMTVPVHSPIPEPTPAPPPEPTPVTAETPGRAPEPALALALVAVTLGGIGLILTEIPYGRFGTVAAAGLGLLLGLVCLGLAERSRVVAVTAAVLNAAVLLVVIALPTWLGLEPWRRPALPDDSKVVKAVELGDTGSHPADWVDISTASWQLDDVRISVPSVRFEPVELTGTNNRKKWTKENFLQIWVRVRNDGVARKYDCQGWSGTPSPGVAVPRLTDSAGKVLAAKTFDPGWEPPGRPHNTALFPGKWALQLLIFEVPSPPADHFRLELPGTAFGSSETVRLLIPRSTINSQPPPVIGGTGK
jgi:hypothetical protein